MEPPKTLSTDNGPPFSSKAFTQFMTKEHIEHITSSPLYPRSNGFIECQIKTIKTALSTCQESKQSVEDLLLNIRTQPMGPHLPSPREILHNRPAEHPQKHHNQSTWKTSKTTSSARRQHKRKTMTSTTTLKHYQTSPQVRKFFFSVQQNAISI